MTAADKSPAIDLPEAPASVSIRCVLRNLETTVTVRDADAYTLVSKRLPKLLETLETMGAAPLPGRSGNGNGSEPAKLCEIHGEPMRKHSKDGRSWWSHVVTDDAGSETWCKGKDAKR
jgi:hypothetical protein